MSKTVIVVVIIVFALLFMLLILKMGAANNENIPGSYSSIIFDQTNEQKVNEKDANNDGFSLFGKGTNMNEGKATPRQEKEEASANETGTAVAG